MSPRGSTPLPVDLRDRIDRDGLAILSGVLGREELAGILRDLENVLNAQPESEGSIRTSRERVYAARNLLQIWPRALEVSRVPAICASVTAILGHGCGLVRALYFDKPPGRSWSLPWHKDMTIAVRENRRPSEHFGKPTTKAGVPHVEAPLRVLDNMLTARIHLDDVTEENGPLLVVPGSHRTGKNMNGKNMDGKNTNQCTPIQPDGARIQPILALAGDVLLMRPLLVHSSGNSREGTWRHRRIVHLEFATAEPLPDGYHWHAFRVLAEN